MLGRVGRGSGSGFGRVGPGPGGGGGGGGGGGAGGVGVGVGPGSGSGSVGSPRGNYRISSCRVYYSISYRMSCGISGKIYWNVRCSLSVLQISCGV